MIVVFEREEDNNMAVLEQEDGSTFNMERLRLPAQARPGDSLEIRADGSIVVLAEETRQRKLRVQKLMDGLWE